MWYSVWDCMLCILTAASSRTKLSLRASCLSLTSGGDVDNPWPLQPRSGLLPSPLPPLHSLPGPLPSPQVAESGPLFRPGCGDVTQANAEWHVRFVSKVRIRLRKSGTPGRLGNLQIGCGSLEKMFQVCQLFCGTKAGLIKVLGGSGLLAVCWLCWVGSFRKERHTWAWSFEVGNEVTELKLANCLGRLWCLQTKYFSLPSEHERS